jgi:hypothetical protein
MYRALRMGVLMNDEYIQTVFTACARLITDINASPQANLLGVAVVNLNNAVQHLTAVPMGN